MYLIICRDQVIDSYYSLDQAQNEFERLCSEDAYEIFILVAVISENN